MAKRKIYGAANRFTFKDALFLASGIAAATVGLKGFLLPNHFLDGGVTGICLIVQKLTGLPFAPLLLTFNMPFIWLGRSSVSRIFALKTCAAISLFALSLWLVDVPHLTRDPLLIALFGGFFAGLGIGLAIRGGAVLDGTEILALYLGRRSSLTVGDYILIINVLIFAAAIYAYSLETAMYAVLTYLCAAKTIDFVVYGIEEYTQVQIFSDHSAALYKIIGHELKVGVKVFHGQRGAPNSRPEKAFPVDILQVVVTRLELARLLNTIEILDPEATVIHHPVTDIHRGRPVETLSRI